MLRRLAVLIACIALAPESGSPDSIQADNVAHTGSVDQALVGIEVTTSAADGASQTVRRGNGFVLRCDGFVLVPASLLTKTVVVAGQSETAGSQSIRVVLNPGKPTEKRFTAFKARTVNREVGYGVIKIDSFHSPALKTLLPDTLTAESQLQVVWSGWDSASSHFQPVERKVTKLAHLEAADEAAGQVGLTEAGLNGPAGAVVTGPDGMAVGILPGGKSDRFISFANLYRATNCVCSDPTPDSNPGGVDVPHMKFNPTVAVPGGKMQIPIAVAAEQPDMEGSLEACIAPFEIDQFEVTNEEYLAYWRTLAPADQRRLGFRSNYYPWTWAPYPAEPFPQEVARLPVLGVALPGAMGYAKWRGKRLPTPYEWCMAAFGPKGDGVMPTWVRAYLSERRAAWNRIRDAHIEFLRQHPQITQNGGTMGGPFKLPWIAQYAPLQPASTFSKQIIDQQLEPLWLTWKDPMYVREVGTREFDTAACGAMDMILNAAELVLPTPGNPARGSARYMEPDWVPQRADPRDPWTALELRVMTSGRPMQPLSRMFMHEYIGPSVQDILLYSSLNEAIQMLLPPIGFRIAMTRDSVSNASTFTKAQNAYGPLGEPAGFQLWRGLPKHYRREMGREVPLNEPEQHSTPGPQLNYYLPVGFRCAR